MTPPKFERNEERRRQLVSLQQFVRGLRDGQIVSWVEVEQKSGVRMTAMGKGLLRLAAKREKRPYLAKQGDGFEMSSPTNGVEIVNGRARRIVSALDIAREVTEQVSGRHMAEMSGDDQARLTRTQALLSTLALSQSLAKKLPGGAGSGR